MCLRHVGEDAVMIMTLVSLFSAGKPFSGNNPSRIKIQPPDAGPTGSPGSGPFLLSLDSFSNLLLPPHPQTHTGSPKIRRKSPEKNHHEREAQGEVKREKILKGVKGTGLKEGR